MQLKSFRRQPIWVGLFLAMLGTSIFLSFLPAVRAEQEIRTNSKTESARPTIAFQHEFSFAAISGLPAEIRFSSEEKSIQAVRAMLSADGKFYVFPLERSATPGLFRANVPSPEKEIRYRFQWEFKDGTTQVSEQFISTPFCGAAEIRAAMSESTEGSTKRDLIRDAILLDRDVERLRYAIEVITGEKIPATVTGGDDND